MKKILLLAVLYCCLLNTYCTAQSSRYEANQTPTPSKPQAILPQATQDSIASSRLSEAQRIERGPKALQDAIATQARNVVVEKLAEFYGGEDSLVKFLQTELTYPADAQKAGRSGRTEIEFMVCEDGSICDRQIVVASGDKSLDQEAMRAVNKIKVAVPASNKGVNVKSYYRIPITFSLDDE
jgi:TonB family protein